MNADLAALRRAYAEDGVVLLAGALPPTAVAEAKAAWDWSLAHPGPGASRVKQASDATFYQDLFNPDCLTGYRAMLEASPLPAQLAALLDCPDLWFFYEQVFLKEGGETRRTPWHQDSSYLSVGGEHLAVAWITFEPMAASDSLEFVKGSHRGPLYNGSRFELGDDTAPLYADAPLPRLPDIEAHRDAIETTEELDPVTQDMLISQASQLEQFHWFIRAHLERADGTLATGKARTEQGAVKKARKR